MIDEAYALAERVLREHADGLRTLAERLLEREVVFTEDVEQIFGRRRKDILREKREAAARPDACEKRDGEAENGATPGAPGDPAASAAGEAAASGAAEQTEAHVAPESRNVPDAHGAAELRDESEFRGASRASQADAPEAGAVPERKTPEHEETANPTRK